jgi:hypothetical protein
MPEASGLSSLAWRSQWEASRDRSHKDTLITYNAEDCEATQKLAETIAAICSGNDKGQLLPVELGINVSSLPRDHSRKFGPVQYALPDFKLINDSAYWHYQRTEIYGRSDASLRKLLIKSESKQKPLTPLTSSVATEPTSRCCPKCSEPTLNRHRTRTKTVFDLTFSKIGVRRRATKLSFVEYRCHKCGCCPPVATRKERYGRGLRSYVVYAQ